MSYRDERRGVPAFIWLLLIIVILSAAFWWFFAVYSKPMAGTTPGSMTVVWRDKGEPFYTIAAPPANKPPFVTLGHATWLDTTVTKVKGWTHQK